MTSEEVEEVDADRLVVVVGGSCKKGSRLGGDGAKTSSDEIDLEKVIVQVRVRQRGGRVERSTLN